LRREVSFGIKKQKYEFNRYAAKMFPLRVLSWRWEREGTVNGKRSFGAAGIWPKLRAILFIYG